MSTVYSYFVTLLFCYSFLHFILCKSAPLRLLSAVFWMVRSLFPLLSSIGYCSIIFVRNRIPSRLCSGVWHQVFAANTPVVSAVWKVKAAVVVHLCYVCVRKFIVCFVQIPQ